MKTCVVLALFLMAGVSLGDIQKRVDNGRPCTADETKSFVFLGIKNQVIRSNFICSGTVIGDGNWILTAKHCEDDGVLGWLFRYLRKFNVKDVTSTVDITSKKTFKHETADIMLIKGNTGMTGMPLVSEADCNDVLKDINTNHVKMVVPARDTKEEKSTETDVSMCAEIDADGLDTMKDTKEEVLLWIPGACDSCKGDSGAGVIYNKALFAVHTGTGKQDELADQDNFAYIVCRGDIRNWIVNTMKDNA